MKQAAHIFRKDLRRLRWSLLGWCAIVAGRAFVETVGANIAFGGFGPLLAIRQISTMLSMIYGLMLAVLVARLVQDEPLVGRDAFWLTRPIASTSVVAAKLAFAIAFLILVPFAERVLVAFWFGTPLVEMIKIPPPFLLNQLIAITVLWAIAALTPSLTRYVIAIVGVIGAFVLFTASTLLIELFIAGEAEENGDYALPDLTPVVVFGGLIVLTALSVIATQYRTRRVSRSLIAGSIGLILVFFVPPNWKWSLATRPAAEIVSPPADVPALSVTLDGSRPSVGESMTLNRRTAPRREIAVPAVVAGVPVEFNIRAIVGRSRLELPNGVVLEDLRGRTRSAAYSSIGGSIVGRESAIEAALGGVRLLNRSPRFEAVSADQLAIVLRVDEEDFTRYRSERGLLRTDLDIVFERGIPRVIMPALDGATFDIDNVRHKIVRVIRRATGCTVLFRRSYVESLFSPRAYGDWTYALRNQSRGEAISSRVSAFHDEGFSAGGFLLPPTRIGGRGFVLEQYDFEFPERRGFNAPQVDLDESWLNGAELVAVEMVHAGYLTRRVTLDGFRMTP